MTIAIPVKTNTDNPAVAPLFGKAKWFAFVQEGNISIKQNPVHGGQEVARWLIAEGVDTVIMQEMGDGPYGVLKAESAIAVYHSGFERITLDEVLERFENGMFEKLDEVKMAKIIEHHESKHSHGDHHHQEGHHGHHC